MPSALSLPGEDPKAPKEANDGKPFIVEDFGGLDTKAKRPAVGPKDFPWIQNWMPIGPGNMRTLYAEGETLYTATAPLTIIHHVPYNLGADRFIAVFLDDGSAEQVDVSDGSVTVIGPAGTFFTSPDDDHPVAAAQYQSKYLVIASEKDDDAYWIWDGTSLFAAGTISPEVTLLNSGDDYTSAPTITAYGGSGSGATFSATVANGVVTDVEVTDPGSGYLRDDLVTLVFTGGGSDNQARATATVDLTTGGVAIVQVTVGGSGYSAPLVSFSGGAGTGAKAFVSGAANGVVTEITVTDPGSGYTSAPTVTITDSGGGTGSGATAVSEIRRGQITSIAVNNGGSGYTGMPDVVISEPNDFGFPLIQAEAYATISAGAVTAITLTNKGIGYKTASVQLSGGNDAAEAEVRLMPFGISGRAIEVYQNRVWVAERTKGSFTGPVSVSDFSTDGGGGSFPATDSFLRERIVQLRQSNGFLYGFGDSSIFVISNLQTSPTTGTTTFNNANVDPQIGSAWRDSVGAFGRALVFANPSGVYALYGGAAEKVSGPLDGLFAKASFNTGQEGIEPTAAIATIFGIRVYMVTLTTTNPFTGVYESMICMWDGQKWFIGTQLKQPTEIATQEIDSELTAWGIDGSELYPLFQTPSADLEKVFQTKLVGQPTYQINSQIMRVYFIAETEVATTEPLRIALDNQSGSNPAQERSVSQELVFVGSGPIQWTGLAGADLDFISRGLTVDGYVDTQYGQLLGATVSTNAPDMTMISLLLFMREYAPIA
jgi:hypothetical protein